MYTTGFWRCAKPASPSISVILPDEAINRGVHWQGTKPDLLVRKTRIKREGKTLYLLCCIDQQTYCKTPTDSFVTDYFE